MCGLVGYLGQGGTKYENAFGLLLVLDQIRGYDSTGIAVVNGALPKDQKITIIKDTVLPPYLIMREDYQALLKQPVRCLIGHNRWATKGTVTKGNAHPFTKRHITGAHNGTLSWMDKLHDHERFGTDSEAVFHNMAKRGVDEAWGSVYGAAALVWWDKKDATLNMLRNSQRPLWFTTSKDGNHMFWASETWMLKVVLDKFRIERDDIYQPEPNYHFAFSYTFKDGVQYVCEELRPAWHASRHPSQDSFPLRHEYKTNAEFRKAIREWNEKNKKALASPLLDVKEEAEKKTGPFPTNPEPTTTSSASTHEQAHTTNKPGSSHGNGTSTTDSSTENKPTNRRARQLWRQRRAEERKAADRYKRNYGIIAWNAADPKITRREFHRKYKNCTFCGEALDGQYGEATILDDRRAACNSCSTVAQEEGINMHGAAR